MLDDKDEIRKYIRGLKKLYNTAETYKVTSSDLVFGKLFSSSEWESAKNVIFYHSLPDELPTVKYLDIANNTKNIFLPRVNGDTLDIVKYSPTSLETGSFSILEPSNNELVDISDIDLVIVPGMAFDKRGNRLGRGKGYYDKLLQNSKCIKIGICYDYQLLENRLIPTEPHDIKMDLILTPSHTIKFKQ